ncbi:MAG TPA: sulfatase [Bacteroidales bacterium]|nr:sulfatase [Bacteroidales bacterium]
MNTDFERFIHFSKRLLPVIPSLIVAGNGNSQEIKKLPNIVIIMADDHASHAISAYGSTINSTPNIDRLAKEGVMFTNAFCTNSISAPSRAVILTGKYSHINGVLDHGSNHRFNGQQETFPKMLKTAGYNTAIIGKWHLVSDPTGFDYWNILPDQGEYFNPDMIENGITIKHKGYVTDIITDKALQWLSNRDTTKPFCLMVHHKAVHANWEADDKYKGLYMNSKIPEPKTFNDDFIGRTKEPANHQLFVGPSQWQLHYQYRFGEMPVQGSFQEKKEWMYQCYMKDYLECVASLDDNVGRLLSYLDQNILFNNTIVIYTSDQGFFLGEHGLYDKRFMYEQSIRMPLIIRYPPEIKPGSVSVRMVLNLDFAPTFLDYAGINSPVSMQGASFRMIARGLENLKWRTSMYYHFYEYAFGIGPHEGIRTERYKLIHFLYGDNDWELYDLLNDPEEMYNIYNDPNTVKIKKKLNSEMEDLKKRYEVNK